MPPRKSNASTGDEGVAGPSSIPSAPTITPSKEKKSDEVVIEVSAGLQFLATSATLDLWLSWADACLY